MTEIVNFLYAIHFKNFILLNERTMSSCTRKLCTYVQMYVTLFLLFENMYSVWKFANAKVWNFALPKISAITVYVCRQTILILLVSVITCLSPKQPDAFKDIGVVFCVCFLLFFFFLSFIFFFKMTFTIWRWIFFFLLENKWIFLAILRRQKTEESVCLMPTLPMAQ